VDAFGLSKIAEAIVFGLCYATERLLETPRPAARDASAETVKSFRESRDE
jgi:hypothetical protein